MGNTRIKVSCEQEISLSINEEGNSHDDELDVMDDLSGLIDGDSDDEYETFRKEHLFEKYGPLNEQDISSEQDMLESQESFESQEVCSHNKALGIRGEKAAVLFLKRLGYEILEQNWTCPAGEVDIIARDGETIVFCEVKTRSNLSKGLPAEAVTAKKRNRYERIAGWFLRDYDEVNIPVRFDVIGLLALGNDRALIRHYINAFGSSC